MEEKFNSVHIGLIGSLVVMIILFSVFVILG
jgi:hypothetical protein